MQTIVKKLKEDDLMKLWHWWLQGGIKGNKRYIIFPLSEAVAIPFGIWLLTAPECSFLQYLVTPKMIVVVLVCLVGGGALLNGLDRFVETIKK